MVGEGGAAGDGRGNAVLQKTYRRILYIENSRQSPSHFSRVVEGIPLIGEMSRSDKRVWA